MSKRRVIYAVAKPYEEGQQPRSVRVYRDAEYNEWVCRLYLDGKLYEPADSFHSDKQDAIDTADIMAKGN